MKSYKEMLNDGCAEGMARARGGRTDEKPDAVKAVHEHERHDHKGEPLTKIKLKRGGKVHGDKPAERADKRARGGKTGHGKGRGGTKIDVIVGQPGGGRQALQEGLAAGRQQGLRAGAAMGARAAAAKMAPPGPRAPAAPMGPNGPGAPMPPAASMGAKRGGRMKKK